MNQNNDCVESPCIENCNLNAEKICLGCFRSIVEITQWSQMDDRTRLDALHKAKNRKKTHAIK